MQRREDSRALLLAFERPSCIERSCCWPGSVSRSGPPCRSRSSVSSLPDASSVPAKTTARPPARLLAFEPIALWLLVESRSVPVLEELAALDRDAHADRLPLREDPGPGVGLVPAPEPLGGVVLGNAPALSSGRPGTREGASAGGSSRLRASRLSRGGSRSSGTTARRQRTARTHSRCENSSAWHGPFRFSGRVLSPVERGAVPRGRPPSKVPTARSAPARAGGGSSAFGPGSRTGETSRGRSMSM